MLGTRPTILSLTLATLLSVGPTLAADPIPVMLGGEPEMDACPGWGEVRGLDPDGDGFLAVRTGPGTGYPMIDRLHEGDGVHFCDERGDWIGIVHGEPGQDCGADSPVARRQPYRGPCKSGWAHRNWLVLLAG